MVYLFLKKRMLKHFLSFQDRDGNPVDVQVKDNGNGTYSCSYTPRKPIKHTIMVSWGGVNIPDSPFRVGHD